jgi:hypothetical protein
MATITLPCLLMMQKYEVKVYRYKGKKACCAVDEVFFPRNRGKKRDKNEGMTILTLMK